jgi:hypothetical protein
MEIQVKHSEHLKESSKSTLKSDMSGPKSAGGRSLNVDVSPIDLAIDRYIYDSRNLRGGK